MKVELPAALVHHFTPQGPPTTWNVVEPVFDRLESMSLEVPDDIPAFLEAWDETSCWIWDEVAKTRVASRAYTDDDEAQARWDALRSDVIPNVSRRTDRLARKLLACRHVEDLEASPYASFLRQVRVEAELFCEENVELLEEEQRLCSRYHQISGGWTFDMDGVERTLSQMQQYTSSSDRAVREEAWRAISREFTRTADELEDLFEQLFELRTRIAANAGFENYRDYMFTKKLRDYGPEACDAFADLVEAEVSPLLEEMASDTCQKLGLDSYRPWDRRAQPDGGDPLRPFENVAELKDGVERMMRRLDPGLGERFARISENMDLESRENKGQGGFMTWYFWDKRPFIFANASGSHSDLVTLLHEAGHALHWLLANEAQARPMDTVVSAKEFSEVASMSMELLHYDTLDEFYGPGDHERAVVEHLRRIPERLATVARGDQFQQWLYTHPQHSREERRAKWQELKERYSPHVDFSAIDDEDLRNRYHLIMHFFTIPFYFIEYGFAQLGALQIAMNAERDREAAMHAYQEALSLGPQRDVHGLYDAAGAEFVPTSGRVREATQWIRSRLKA